MKNQNGFTLVELVIVIVLLGVLAAIAVPRFVNLEDDAQRSARNATAAALTSAMNINYAGCAVNNHAVGADCVAVANCSDAAAVLSNGTSLIGALATQPYSVGASALPAGNGSTASCDLTQKATSTAVTFTAVRAGTTP
jgi:MSHA pilin protein MshA